MFVGWDVASSGDDDWTTSAGDFGDFGDDFAGDLGAS